MDSTPFKKHFKDCTPFKMNKDLEITHRLLMISYANKDFDCLDVIDLAEKQADKLKLTNYKQGTYYSRLFAFWRYRFLLTNENPNKSLALASSALKKACKKGSPEALLEAAYHCYKGAIFTKTPNPKLAEKFLKKGMKGDSFFSDFILANIEKYKDNYEASIPLYKKAIEKGVLEARYHLADSYYVLAKNLDEAIKLYEECKDFDWKERVEKIKQYQKDHPTQQKK